MGKFNLSQETQKSDITEKDLTYEYELSENVVEDLVEYSRSCIVKNEQQFVLTMLGYVSGFMDSPKDFVSGVLIGTAGSGKSHLQNKVEALFPDSYLYKATTGSDTSIIYDDTWEDAYLASLDELNKPSDKVIEILKSLHGGEDEEFRYKVTGDGRGADRDVDEIVRSAIPYWFLYAQYEPDFEMWDRLLKVPVHESRDKNRGVARTQWDHTMIEFGDSEYEYMFDFDDGKKAIIDHIRHIPKNSAVKIPAGEEEFGWDAFEHAEAIFDIERSETNRVSGMVANLVRASCLLNHPNRETITKKVDGETKEMYVAEKQDLANILKCRDVLLATTHELDRKKKALCLAIQETSGAENMASIKDIQNHLRKTNASFVKRHQIEQMLDALIQNYLVEKHERAGQNGAHLYQFNGWQSLGKLDITEEFVRVFEDCVDPFSGESFIDAAKEQNQQLRPSMEEFMSEASVSTNSSDSSDGQATLTGEDSSIELTKLQEAVRERLYETLNGVRVDGLEERDPSLEEMLGVSELGEEPEGVDYEGTLFDINNTVWLHESGVEERSDIEERIEKTLRQLATKGVFETDVVKMKAGTPAVMQVSVMAEEDL